MSRRAGPMSCLGDKARRERRLCRADVPLPVRQPAKEDKMKPVSHPPHTHVPHHGARYYFALAAGLTLPALAYLLWAFVKTH